MHSPLDRPRTRDPRAADPAQVHRSRRRALLVVCALLGALVLLLPVLRQGDGDGILKAKAPVSSPHTR